MRWRTSSVHTSRQILRGANMVMRLVDSWRGENEPANLKSIIYGGGTMYVADCLRALDVSARSGADYGQGEAPMTIAVLPSVDHVDDYDGLVSSDSVRSPRAKRLAYCGA